MSDTEQANLHRLADALNELECRLVLDPADPKRAADRPKDRAYFAASGESSEL